MKKTVMFVAVAALLGGACTTRISQAVGTPAPITFATMDAHSQIQVDYETQGCYHHYQWHFAFTKKSVLQVAGADGEQAPSIQTASAALNEAVNARPVWQSKDAGVLTLTPARAVQLDNLLAFYRYHSLHPATEGSTTYDTITYTFLRDGKTIATETFQDSSGLTDLTPEVLTLLGNRVPYGERNKLVSLTTFWRLHQELTAKTKNAKAGR